MNIKYFNGVVDVDGLKFTYRKLAMEFHPDKGGDESVMKAINAEYEYLLKTGRFKHRGTDKECNVDYEIALRDIIEKAIILDGLDIEICGTWLWFDGETKAHKDVLKGLGCRYAPKKQKWYYRDESQKMYRFKGRKAASMEEIRERYGSSYVPKKTKIKLK